MHDSLYRSDRAISAQENPDQTCPAHTSQWPDFLGHLYGLLDKIPVFYFFLYIDNKLTHGLKQNIDNGNEHG